MTILTFVTGPPGYAFLPLPDAVKQAAKFLVKSHYREATIIFRIDNQAAVRALANPVITLQQVLECYQVLQKLANRNRVSIRPRRTRR